VKHGIDFEDAARIFEGQSWNRQTSGATTARNDSR
jgi:hypothetical protein